MFDGDNVFAAIVSFTAHLRAYAIRPYTCSIDFWGVLGGMFVSFPPTSGRMRYAPTLVRLKSRLYWDMCWFHFRSFQGVCDTPLHLFGWNRGYIGVCVGSVFAHLRAYAIRPYTCSVEIDDLLGYVLVLVLVSFPLILGRMRYAATVVRRKTADDSS